MEFLGHAPPAPLARFVEHLWLARSGADEPAVEGDQFPAGGVSVLFNLGPPQALIDADTRGIAWYDGAWAAGERERPLRLGAPWGSDLVGIQFRPGAAGAFLGVPLGALAGRIVDLADLWPDAAQLRERLALAPGSEARLALLERELQARLVRARNIARAATHERLDALVEHAVEALRRRGAGASIGGLADDLGLSRRHLARVFADRVGLGPKALHRVLRFQRVIRATAALARPAWAEIAVRCGYFDQAHLIRDFRRYAGIAPTEYLARRSVDPNFADAARP
jgi:AraC-like DNA-binding protein